MKERTSKIVAELFAPRDALEGIRESALQAGELLRDSFAGGGKLLVCGNGGSWADGEHIVGELMKGFLLKRPLPDDAKRMLTLLWGDEGRAIGEVLQGALPAISLGSHGALMTAFANDADGRFAFAQQAMGYARPGDVALGISTSGNAENVRFALMAAKSRGASTVALTGADGGLLAKYADCCIRVPDRRTFRVQEHHLRIYHFLCAFVESELFDE